MRAEIMAHKFIEFGKHQQHLYGVKADSVMDVISTGKMCILDVHPQVCVCVCVCVSGWGIGRNASCAVGDFT